MPGTEDLDPLLILEPPPIDPDLVFPGMDDDDRDYAPNPIAEFALTARASTVFSPQSLTDSLTRGLRQQFRRPTFFVRTPKGQITYMQSGDAPTEATALIASWPLRDDREGQVNEIAEGADTLSRWLSRRPEGFELWRFDRADLERQREQASRILEVKPDYLSLIVMPAPGQRFDGKRLWRTLHAIGLQWGDCDQFHWNDPTNQTDYLFSAEVDDGALGYALPEEISAGRQHFDVIKFGFALLRSPHPSHVLGQMIRAADAAARELNGLIKPCIDGAEVRSVAELARAVDGVVQQLSEMGVKPGSRAVCMLR